MRTLLAAQPSARRCPRRAAEKKEFAGGITGVISFFLLILAADVALFAYEQLTYMQKTGAL